jgi:hypothetical protein
VFKPSHEVIEEILPEYSTYGGEEKEEISKDYFSELRPFPADPVYDDQGKYHSNESDHFSDLEVVSKKYHRKNWFCRYLNVVPDTQLIT